MITLLIKKDYQRRLSAAKTLEVAQQLLAQLYVCLFVTCTCQLVIESSSCKVSASYNISVTLFRSDEHPIGRTQTCDSQVVPDSGDEAVLTDCVVPIGKLSLETHSGDFTSDFHPPPLGSWFLNSEVSVEPLLRDYQYATISEPSYHMPHSLPDRTLLPQYTSCHHHHGDLSVTCTTPPLRENEFPHSYSRRIDTSTTIRPVSDDGYTNFTRHAVSTEHLSVLVAPNMATETQRVRRNSSGSESRARRHSTASYRMSSQMQRHRRRSHDVRDEQVDLLERLHVAATRRRSLSSPFQTSPRSQNSYRPNNYRM